MRGEHPRGTSGRDGAWHGAALASAAALEMLRLNAGTINPVSGSVLAAVWLAAGALAGAPLGALGARGWRILRLHPGDGAAFLSTITVGHLLLPLGFGAVLALIGWAARILRRAFLPRHARLDALVLLALAVGAAETAAPDAGSLPPRIPDTLGAGTPSPGAVPVTVTVHPPGSFPEVAALHARLAPLASDAPGRDAALWTGRLPMRTGAGPSHPRTVPGGGGVARIPDRPGTRALVRLFPRARDPRHGAFAPRGTLQDVARAGGIPVLAGWPAPGDPPLSLRALALDAPPTDAQARALADAGAWIDVETAPDGGGEIALAGRGIRALPAATLEATLLDVAPTALHLLGLAVPRETDGRVLLEFLESPGPGSRPVRYRPLAPAGRSAAGAPAIAARSATTPR